jgi:hypothetical protein
LGTTISQWVTTISSFLEHEHEHGDEECDLPVSTAIQAVEGLRHVQSQDIEFEHSIRNDKEKDMDILSSRHDTSSVECCFVSTDLYKKG